MRLIAGQHIPWKEQLDVNEVEAQCDEFGWDEMFEMLDTPMNARTAQAGLDEEVDTEGRAERIAALQRLSPASSIRRAALSTGIRQRQSSPNVKKAAATNWDTEFSNAQAHAREVLAKLGR